MDAILYNSDNNSYVPQTLYKHQYFGSVDQQCSPCVMQEGSSAHDLHTLGAGHAEGHTWDLQDLRFLQKPCAGGSRVTSGIRPHCMRQVDQNKGNDVSVTIKGTTTKGFKNVYPWMKETQSATSSLDTPSSNQSGLKTFLLQNRCFLGVSVNNI